MERIETDQHKSGTDFIQWIHEVRLESTTMFIYKLEKTWK